MFHVDDGSDSVDCGGDNDCGVEDERADQRDGPCGGFIV